MTEQIRYNVENKFKQFEQKIKLYSIDEDLQETMKDIYKSQDTPFDITKHIINSNMNMADG